MRITVLLLIRVSVSSVLSPSSKSTVKSLTEPLSSLA
jgi:hypothetical protein